MVDSMFPVDENMEEKVDFACAIMVKSMLEIYKYIENDQCKCGGKWFPTGPVGLKHPDGYPEKLKFELMVVYCSKCENEEARVFGVDTQSDEFIDEQKRAYADLPRWERHTEGNPIDIDEE